MANTKENVVHWWQLVLYAVASLLALKSLTTLMSNHRNHARRDAAIQARLRSMAREAEEKADAAKQQTGAAPKRSAQTG